jgi:hypothetical protein
MLGFGLEVIDMDPNATNTLALLLLSLAVPTGTAAACTLAVLLVRAFGAWRARRAYRQLVRRRLDLIQDGRI